MVHPISIRCLCSSMPVILGIWTSAIKQAVSTRRGDARKSAADENASTAKPKDLMSLPMEFADRSIILDDRDQWFLRHTASQCAWTRHSRSYNNAVAPALQLRLEMPPGNARTSKRWLSLDANGVSKVRRCSRASVRV